MKLKQRPEDFSVVEGFRFEPAPHGEYFVYRMDKQKLSTLQAVERLRERFHIKRRDVSFCGLKDKQGRTEQLIAVHGRPVEMQEPDLRLTFLGRSKEPLSARNITSNRFSVIVRDLSEEDVAQLPESVAEVSRVGVVNYFDSQRFGFVKHGQGFIAKDILRGDYQAALKALIATPSPLDRTLDANIKGWFRDHWGEWKRHPPQQGWQRYLPILERLRDDPRDFGGALLALDSRMRAMIVFELQSALWNEAVSRWLRAKVPARDLVFVRYQLGALPLPRAVPAELAPVLRDKTFPLLAPDSTFDDPEVREASLAALAREKLTLRKLKTPDDLPAFHFKHEERQLVVFPGKLHSGEARPDEQNRGRLKVTLSFTLPPGAYATLVVRRVMWFTEQAYARDLKPSRAAGPSRKALQPALPAPEAAREAEAPKPRAKPKGFLERQRERKAAKATARDAAKAGRPEKKRER